jgi:hypothetical protein
MTASFLPSEADPPLIVDADGVLAGTVSLQPFKPIAWWDEQFVDPCRAVEKTQFQRRFVRDLDGQPASAEASPNPFRFTSCKASDRTPL